MEKTVLPQLEGTLSIMRNFIYRSPPKYTRIYISLHTTEIPRRMREWEEETYFCLLGKNTLAAYH